MSVPVVAGGRSPALSLIVAAVSLCGLAACLYLRRRIPDERNSRSEHEEEANRFRALLSRQAVQNNEVSQNLVEHTREIAKLRGKLEEQGNEIAELQARLEVQPEPSPELIERLKNQEQLIADLHARLDQQSLPTSEWLDWLEKIEQRLENQEEQMVQVRHLMEKRKEESEASQPPQNEDTVDLGDMGKQDIAQITAATMDRSVFPRLAAALDEARQGREGIGSPGSAIPPDLDANKDLLTRNIYREWELARRANDLRTCRRLYAAFVDAWEPATAVAYRTELEALSVRVEEKLREAFRHHIHEADYAAAIEVGDEICELFPEFPIAAEYERIRPYLARRVV